MSEVPRASDTAGHDILDIMAEAPRYAAWQIERVEQALGRRILEIGSGIGTISQELRRRGPELLVLTDIDPAYRAGLSRRFGGDVTVRVESLVLPDVEAEARYAPDELDTTIALNVVEHIEDDVAAVRTMGEIVRPGGHVIVLVPAMQSIYGELDRALGHYRRYSRRSLAALMVAAGLEVCHVEWFNRVGVLGWWWNGKVRGVDRVPVGQLRQFDRLVPLLRQERWLPLPFGQSVIAIGRRP